jgi:hypothetical protein
MRERELERALKQCLIVFSPITDEEILAKLRVLQHR